MTKKESNKESNDDLQGFQELLNDKDFKQGKPNLISKRTDGYEYITFLEQDQERLRRLISISQDVSDNISKINHTQDIANQLKILIEENKKKILRHHSQSNSPLYINLCEIFNKHFQD
jgi:hypothetical protein